MTPHDSSMFILFGVTVVVIVGTSASAWLYIRRESNKLFKVMVYFQHQSFSEYEMAGIYPALCKAYGFDEV